MTVTHSDGYPVVPTVTDALLSGVGERYDVFGLVSNLLLGAIGVVLAVPLLRPLYRGSGTLRGLRR
jgi:FtsP/CotA-like multicopper oxidase with cupredoxin domain